MRKGQRWRWPWSSVATTQATTVPSGTPQASRRVATTRTFSAVTPGTRKEAAAPALVPVPLARGRWGWNEVSSWEGSWSGRLGQTK